MLRPLIISSPNPLGTGGQVRNYYVLKELIQRDLIKDCILITDGIPIHTIQELEMLGCIVININISSKIMMDEQYLFNLLLLKLKTLKKDKYDLVVSQSEHPKYVQTAYIIHKLFGIPWTAIIQSYLWLDPFRYSSSPTTMIRTSISINLLNKTLVHVISDAIPKILKSKGINLRFYSLLEIPLGLDHKLIDQVLKERHEKIYDLAYMARIAPGKGVLDLIYVVYKLRNVGIDAKVLVIGGFHDEDLRKKFMRYAEKLGILKNFTFTGPISGIEKYRLLSKAKVFVYPSRIDVVPISLLEAMAVGLPATILNSPYANFFESSAIVAQNIEEMTKIIHTLLLSENQREELGRNARAFSRKFTYEAAAQCEYKAYLKTLEWFTKFAKV